MDLFPFCDCRCLVLVDVFIFVFGFFKLFFFCVYFPSEYLEEGFSSAGGFSGVTVGFPLIHNAVEQLFGFMTSGLL